MATAFPLTASADHISQISAATLVKIHAENAILQEKVDHLMSLFEQHKSAYEQTVAKSRHEWRHKEALYTQQINRLQQQIANQRRALEVRENALKSAQQHIAQNNHGHLQEIRSLKKRIKQKAKRSKDKDSEIARLQQDVSSKDKELSSLHDRLHHLNAVIMSNMTAPDDLKYTASKTRNIAASRRSSVSQNMSTMCPLSMTDASANIQYLFHRRLSDSVPTSVRSNAGSILDISEYWYEVEVDGELNATDPEQERQCSQNMHCNVKSKLKRFANMFAFMGKDKNDATRSNKRLLSARAHEADGHGVHVLVADHDRDDDEMKAADEIDVCVKAKSPQSKTKRSKFVHLLIPGVKKKRKKSRK